MKLLFELDKTPTVEEFLQLQDEIAFNEIWTVRGKILSEEIDRIKSIELTYSWTAP